jgi:hypothetical protein
MTGGFQDSELADDLVGVTSARLLAAGVPRLDRMRAMRLLGVLVNVADARRRVRRPLAELAVEFDLPVDEVDGWLDHLVDVGAVRWEDGKLVLAALEPPAAGGLRLHDFLSLAGEPTAEPRRRAPLLRPAGAVLAAAAVLVLALLAPGVVRDQSTPASTTRDEAPAGATTTAPAKGTTTSARPTTTSTSAAADEQPTETVPDGQRIGPVVVPTTTTLALPCPTGNPLLQVLGTTTGADGFLAVDGLAHNGSAEELVVHAFTLTATIDGQEISAPGLDHDLVIAPHSTVLWQAKLPITGPAGTLVQVALGGWGWSNPSLPSTCTTPPS